MVNAAKKFIDVVDQCGEHPMRKWLLLQLEVVVNASDWLEAWTALQATGNEVSTPASILESDAGQVRLKQTLKAAKKLDGLIQKVISMEASFSQEAHDQFSALLSFDCRSFAAPMLEHPGLMDVLHVKASNQRLCFEDLCKDLKTNTKELFSEAESWKRDLSESCSLQDLLDKAKTTLDTVDGELVSKQCEQLAEERGSWSAL